MTDEIYVHEAKALQALMRDGDFTEAQARIVLVHSLKQSMGGETYYPAAYIAKRAADNAARCDEPEDSRDAALDRNGYSF